MKKTNISNLQIYQTVLAWRDKALRPLAIRMTAWGITADHLSFARLLLAVPLFFTVGHWPLWGVVILLVNFLVDGVDGVLARWQKKDSLRGRTLDVSIDNFFIVPVILGLIFTNSVNSFWAAFYLVNILINYFLNYLRHGIDIGKFPFSFSKYFVYAAILFYGLWFYNVYDVILVFWSVFLITDNLFLFYKIYRS